jgi:hypothetical protein
MALDIYLQLLVSQQTVAEHRSHKYADKKINDGLIQAMVR